MKAQHNIEDIYELSPMQQGILFEELSEPEAARYTVQLRLTLEGVLDVGAMGEAWEQVIRRHGLLRTGFHWKEAGKSLQVVRRAVGFAVRQLDWRSLSAQEQEQQLATLITADRQQEFDLAQPPLMRLTLVRLAEERHQLIWSHHHLLFDGWSMPLLLKEVFTFYEALARGEALHLPAPRPYRDYIQWLQQQDMGRAEEFWRERLRGFSSSTKLSIERPVASPGTGAQANGNGSFNKERGNGEEQLRLSEETTQQLQALARHHQLTLNTIVQGAWALLLSRYSGNSDVLFGATVSGRPTQLSGVEQMLGLFINTLPVRVKVEGGERVIEWLQRMQAEEAAAREFEYTPLVEVQRWSEIERGQALFDSILVFMNYPVRSVLREQARDDARLQVANVQGFEKTNFPLSIIVVPGQRLSLQLSYETNRFEKRAVEQIAQHLKTLLEGIAVNPEQRLSELPMLSDAERRQLLFEWNDTHREYPQQTCVHELFEQHATRTPDQTAAVFEDTEMSFAELNRKANQLAHYLQALGIKPDMRVGICLERSLEMLIGILGVLKAGGAYVPLDPLYPQQRLAFMLEDSQAPVLLTERHVMECLPEHSAHVVCLDTDRDDIALQCEDNPRGIAQAETAAYVIYTSGSTGQPKGSVVTHQSLVNYALSMCEQLDLQATDRILQFASFSFDVFVEEVFPTWASGAAVVLTSPEWLASTEDFTRLLKRQRVTGCELPAPYWHEWVYELVARGEEAPPSLRFVMLGCEKPSPERLAQWQRFNVPLIQVFGLTETTITTTLYKMPPGCECGEASYDLPIGQPIANTQTYVLDRHLQPVPVGVVGEMYIGGIGLARCYLNRAEATAERYIPHLFSTTAGARLYRTGDLARYLPDGNLQFLGRADEQVKIRGFRVELGEIEAVLSQHQQVREAVVVAQEATTGQQRLVGYVVPANGEQAQPNLLRQYLAEKLPEHMIPSVFVELAELPLTPNGKVDRRALPAPDASRLTQENAFVAPRTPVEEQLCAIWQQVLGLEQIGIHDNFFSLGGDSILSIQIVARANQAGLSLSPRLLFQHQSVAALAGVAATREQIKAEQGRVSGQVPLTPIQHWFFEQVEVERQHWNQSVLLESRHSEIERGALGEAVRAVVEHHDALRMRFTESGEGWEQECLAEATEPAPLTIVDLSTASILASDEQRRRLIESAANEAQRSLSLGNGEMLRVVLFECGQGQPPRLLIVIHHLVVDGVSWRVLLEDLETAYHQVRQGAEVRLPQKTTSFKQWAEALAVYARSTSVQQQSDYWLAAAETVSRLPRDFHSSPDETLDESASTSAHVLVKLSREETRALLQEVPSVYHTEINDVLLTTLAQALSQWSGEPSVLIELEGHGREEISEQLDISRTVGWFTTLYPVRLQLSESRSVGDDLKAVKERLRGVPERGLGYGLLKYVGGDEETRAKLREARAEVAFNYLGQLDNVVSEERMFRGGQESSGAEQDARGRRSHALIINASVQGGELVLGWSYSKQLHGRETIERVAAEQVERLRQVVEHCREEESGGYTPSDFPLARLSQRQLDEVIGTERKVEDLYPLSPMQQGMLFHSLYAPEAGEYIAQFVLTLENELNVGAFRAAWQQMVERHAALRAAYIWGELGEPVQVVRERVEIGWEEQDWRSLTEREQEQQMASLLAADRGRGFDFTRPPLMRLTLVRLAEHKQKLVWTLGMMILDGWSMPLVLKEVFTFYDALSRGETLSLPSPRPYRDYIHWLQHQDMARAEAFWRERLRGFHSPTQLTVERLAASIHTDALSSPEHGYGEQRLSLSEQVTAQLQALARHHQLTLNTIVQGAWALLLSRYSGSEDVVFGATVSGRPAELSGVEQMLGLFINTLPVRVKIEGSERVIQWLQRMQAEEAEARQYEYTPLVEVQRWSEVERGLPLFDSILVFENYPVDASLLRRSQEGERAGLEISAVESDERTNYGLAVAVLPGREMGLRLSYESSRYGDQVIERMLGHLSMVLESMAGNAQMRICEIEMLSAAERQQLLVEWNETQRDYQKETCLHELIEEQVERTPEAVAVVEDGRQLSFEELNRRANRLARYLREQGVGVEDRVGVLLERSTEMVVALLAVMKVGAAYVPLDASYPEERINYTLEDCGAKVVLTQSALAARVSGEGSPKRVSLDEVREEVERRSAENLESQVSGKNLVYVIYTSGSTGRPKGVMISHREIVNYISWCREVFAIGEGHGSPLHAPITFDGTKTSLFFPLVVGQSLVLVDESLGVEGLVKSFQSGEQYSLIKITPAHLEVLSQMLSGEQLAGRAKTLIVGGESLWGENLSYWSKHAPETRLIQEYGPTETTVSSCWYEIPVDERLTGAVPIGRPISNTQFYILDAAGQPVAVGVSGEVYIGGDGLARGYLNQPGMTAERFVPDPFSTTPGARLYRTGDIGRYLEDGNIEFLGRADHQVKIRGFRIELGEIEAVLCRHRLVREAIVVTQEATAGQKRLVGYVVAEGVEELSTGELRQHLAETLPEHMIPSVLMVLEEMPLTPNGKVDRRALPAPDASCLGQENAYVAPRTPIEELTASIWQQVLGLEQVGIHDNFFELGGHSLLATQVVSRLRQTFSVELPLRALFDAPTVEALAERINAASSHTLSLAAPALQAVSREERLPLSFAQQRLWFLQQLEPESTAYNLPLAVRLTGSLDCTALQRSLSEIVRRHEVLRTTFSSVSAEPGQVIHPAVEVSLPLIDLSALPADERAREAERLSVEEAGHVFSLESGPLLRARLIKQREDEHVVLFTMHHIVSDGWSMGVLVKEVGALYSSYVAGEESALEELSIQYADYAAWQRDWLQGQVLEAELSYWREQLAGAPAVLELPTDYPRPAVPTMRGALDTFKLAPVLTEGLRGLSRSAGVTMFMTMLAAFQVLLARYSKKNDLNVGTVIAGRNQGETEGLIGFFVNTLVLRGQMGGNPRFEELLGQVREVCLGAYAHQDVPFEKLVEELQPERKLGHSPLFQVAFGLDNAPKETLELPGLTLDMAGIEHNVARFDLTLWIHETGDGLIGIWTYSTDLFEAATIKRMTAHYERLLQGIVAHPEARLSSFEIFTEEEKRERELSEKKRAETNAQKLMNVRRKAVSSGVDATM